VSCGTGIAGERAILDNHLSHGIFGDLGQIDRLAACANGETRSFGRGANPINFVSAYDVAQFVAYAVEESKAQGECIEVGGPENLTMRQVAQTIMRLTKISGAVSAVPLALMRMMAPPMRLFYPTLARQIQAAIVMDIADMSFDTSEARRRYPSLSCANLANVVRRDFSIDD
jgi:nucleoside-diphosphate-sugar epimerase